MTFLGMDTEQTRTYADTCARQAQALEDLQGRLDAVINGVAWMGPDRDAFTSEWHHHARHQLTSAHELLNNRAQQLLIEAAQQDHASAPNTDPTAGLFNAGGSLAMLSTLARGIADASLSGQMSQYLGSAENKHWSRNAFDDYFPGGAFGWDLLNGFDPNRPAMSANIVELIRRAWESAWKIGQGQWNKYWSGHPDFYDPWARQAAREFVEEGIENGSLQHNTQVESHGVREVLDSETPQSLEDLILHNDETRATITTDPPRSYYHRSEGQVRIQKFIDEYGQERYLIHVPPTQGEELKTPERFIGTDPNTGMPNYDPILDHVGTYEQQGQPFGWDNNIYAMAGMENAGANAVKLAMEEAGVPPGAEVAFVGHSQGGLVAAQLAADPTFNGDTYNVTDVFSVGSPVETYIPANPNTDVTNIHHIDGVDGIADPLAMPRNADPVPTLDLAGRSNYYPMGNPAPNVKEVSLATPEPSEGFTPESHGHKVHESVIWDNSYTRDEFDPDSGYYGSVANNADHPGIRAKDTRMRGKYYGESVTMVEDQVVSVGRAR